MINPVVTFFIQPVDSLFRDNLYYYFGINFCIHFITFRVMLFQQAGKLFIFFIKRMSTQHRFAFYLYRAFTQSSAATLKIQTNIPNRSAGILSAAL